MSSAATTARPSEAGHSTGWFASALEAMHITAHHETRTPEELAQELLKRVQEELGAAWGPKEAAFCDAACLQRYLRARSMDVT
jgi:hypothetical protein